MTKSAPHLGPESVHVRISRVGCSVKGRRTTGCREETWQQTPCFGITRKSDLAVDCAQSVAHVLVMQGRLYLFDVVAQLRILTGTASCSDDCFGTGDPQGGPIATPQSRDAASDGCAQALGLPAGATSLRPGCVEEKTVSKH